MLDFLTALLKGFSAYMNKVRSRPPFTKKAQADIDTASAKVIVGKKTLRDIKIQDKLDADALGVSLSLYRSIERKSKQLGVSVKDVWHNTRKYKRRKRKWDKDNS